MGGKNRGESAQKKKAQKAPHMQKKGGVRKAQEGERIGGEGKGAVRGEKKGAKKGGGQESSKRERRLGIAIKAFMMSDNPQTSARLMVAPA